MTTGITLYMPKDIETIIREVRAEMKGGARFGPTNDQEEHGAREIIDRIKSRGFSDSKGFDRYEYSPTNPMENLSVFNWAAKQYFKILLTDLRRYPEFFQDHQSCDCEDR